MKTQLKTNIPDIRPGDTVRVHQKIPARIAAQSVAGGKEKDRSRGQVFEGLVIARKHGKEAGATITVRKVLSGVGVEKIIPLHSPIIDKIETVKRGKVRRAKLYYMREARGRKARLKNQEFAEAMPAEIKTEEAEQPAEE